MSAKPTVLDILEVSENAAADDALVEGLARSSAPYQKPILEVLLKRGKEPGLIGIVAQFHKLDEKLLGLISENGSLFFPVLKQCIKLPQERTRANTLELIGRVGNYRLAYLLSVALHDTRASIRQRAAELFRSLADRYFRQERVTLDVLVNEYASTAEQVSVQAFSLARLAEERSYLLSAVDEGLTDYEVHLRPEVAETAIWFSHHINERLWRAVASGRSRCGRAVLDVIQSSKDPRIVPFLYEALTLRDLRPMVAHTISTRSDDAFMTEFVRWAVLVADTRIQRGLSSVRTLAWLERGNDHLLGLPSELFPRLVELILATGLTTDRKIEVFRELLMHGERQAQRAALWGLVAIDDELSSRIIRLVVQWEDAELAGIALREMRRRRPDDFPVTTAERAIGGLSAPLESPAQKAADSGFGQYWRNYDSLEEEDRYDLALALLKTDPSMLPQLRQKLTASMATERLKALQVINLLEIAQDMKAEVYRIARDPDAHVRSAAMIALGQLPGPTGERILLDALNDPDDRVQANSIESLERLRATSRMAQIRQRLASDDNRVRAQAIKATLCFQAREALAVLLDMLGHRAPVYRLSALWVVETLDLMGLAAHVIRVAKEDADPKVRRRAMQALTPLQAALRGGGTPQPSTAAAAEEVAR
jgi:hypothetical protein